MRIHGRESRHKIMAVPHAEKLCIINGINININATIKGHHVYQTDFPVGTKFTCYIGQENTPNQSINQSIIFYSANIPGEARAQWRDIQNQCSTAKSRKQFRNSNRPWGMTVSTGERPNQRDVSSYIS